MSKSLIGRHKIAYTDTQKGYIRRMEKKGYTLEASPMGGWKYATKNGKTIKATSLWALNKKIK